MLAKHSLLGIFITKLSKKRSFIFAEVQPNWSFRLGEAESCLVFYLLHLRRRTLVVLFKVINMDKNSVIAYLIKHS